MRSWRLRLGAFLLSLFMNGFYGLKAVRKNLPVDMQTRSVAVQAGHATAPHEPDLSGLGKRQAKTELDREPIHPGTPALACSAEADLPADIVTSLRPPTSEQLLGRG